MNEKLELLSLAKEFEITKSNYYDNRYEISTNYGDLYAIIDEKDIEYYINGNKDGDDSYIDIEKLMKLKEFCEFLIK